MTNEPSAGPRLTIYSICLDSPLELPYADGGIKAGFPSPAQDYISGSIDINQELVRHPECTFYARVDGDSMEGMGIFDGDIVVIDKSLEGRDGDLVAAFIAGEFTLKRFRMDDDGRAGWLMPANKRYKPIRVGADDDFRIWGVVVGVVRKIRR